jgi:predicted porin
MDADPNLPSITHKGTAMKIRFALVAAATALVAMPSWAQTSVPVTGSTNITISGLLAVGVKNQDISTGNSIGSRTVSSETGVYDNTSRLAIASTSKITEGWNVIFRVESRFTPNVRPGSALLPAGAGAPAGLAVNDATGWADGDTWGGVSSPYGSIVVGKNTLYYTDTLSAGYLAPSLEQPGEGYRIWDCNGLGTFNLTSTFMTGSVSAAGVFTPVKQNILGLTRSQNVVRYDSILFKPDTESLLQFSLAWTKNAAAAQQVWTAATASYYEGGETIYGKVLYNGHGFSASASYLDQKFQGLPSVPTTPTVPFNNELKATRLGLSYKWQGLKFGVVYDSTDMSNGIFSAASASLSDAKRNTIEVPISYSFGDHAVYATWTKAGNTSSIADSGAKQLNFVYDYALTKRAFVGIAYTKIDNDAHSLYQGFLTGYSPFGGTNVAVPGESWRQISLNLNYWF